MFIREKQEKYGNHFGIFMRDLFYTFGRKGDNSPVSFHEAG